MDMLSLEQLGDEIAELSTHLDAATAHLLDLIREFDSRAGWNTGFRSCAAWLSWRVGLDIGAARERVRVAHALETLPRLAQALARGELSYAKVRVLTRVATPETEERLLTVGRAGTADHVEPHRARMASNGPQGRGSRGCASARLPRTARVSNRRRYSHDSRAAGARGRRRPRAGAQCGPRSSVSTGASADLRQPREHFRGDAHDGPAASRRSGAACGISTASRDRSRHSGRALSGCGACRRAGAGGSGRFGSVGSRARYARFRGNVSASGV